MSDDEIVRAAAAVDAAAFDVDGVFTDGGFFWDGAGGEWKRFCFADVMGVSIARKAGLKLALISGESGPILDRLAAKLMIEDVYGGCKDKAAAFTTFVARHGLSHSRAAFMGDDVNDLGALALAGLSAAPANAQLLVREKVMMIAKRTGGNGAVRELLDLVLSARTASATGSAEGGRS